MKIAFSTALTLALLTLTACKDISGSWRVLEVSSGDKLRLVRSKNSNTEYRSVQLCGADAKGAREEEAKKLLVSLIKEADNTVIVVPMPPLRYRQRKKKTKGVVLAEVYLPSANPDEKKSLDAELLVRGLARVPLGVCDNQETFLAAERDAKKRRVGIWSDK